MSESLTLEPPGKPAFDYLPIGLFGSVMGLTGLTVAWQLAHERYGIPDWISLGLGVLALLAFAAVATGYLVKAITAWSAVKTEFNHPIAGKLFGTALISLLLLPIPVARFSPATATGLWIAGAGGMLCFAFYVVSRWMSDRQQIAHATPAWMVPVVGLLDLPLAVPRLDLPPVHGLMVFALAVGLFFAIPLFTLIFSRLVFEAPIPDSLKPSLMILVAPFAVGYSTYTAVTGQVDLFAEALYMLTLFMLAVLIGLMRYLKACCPFRISWWAVGFPLAACAIAGLRFAIAEPSFGTDLIALLLLALASITILALTLRTLIGLARGELRRLSG